MRSNFNLNAQIKVLLLLLSSFVSLNLPAQNPSDLWDKKTFSDVKCILYINYEHRVGSGDHIFKKYTITPGKSGFFIEGTLRNGSLSQRGVPYTKEEQKKTVMPSTAPGDSTMRYREIFSSLQSDHNFSVKEVYLVNNIEYAIYKHIRYNCYDPLCGSRHGHTTFEIGEFYFSPEYGILIESSNNVQFELMVSIKEKKVPHDLVIAILKAKGISKRIIAQYTADTK